MVPRHCRRWWRAERLAEIQEQAKAHPKAAIDALEKMRSDFKGFRVAGAAARVLAKLKSGQASDTTTKPEPVEPEQPKDREPQPKPKPSPKPKDEQARQVCARWLNVAKNLIANDKKDAARPYLERIVKRYPDSPEATEARLLLEP